MREAFSSSSLSGHNLYVVQISVDSVASTVISAGVNRFSIYLISIFDMCFITYKDNKFFRIYVSFF